MKKSTSGVPRLAEAGQRLNVRRRVRFAPLRAEVLPAEPRVSACRGWTDEMSGPFDHPADLSTPSPGWLFWCICA